MQTYEQMAHFQVKTHFSSSLDANWIAEVPSKRHFSSSLIDFPSHWNVNWIGLVPSKPTFPVHQTVGV